MTIDIARLRADTEHIRQRGDAQPCDYLILALLDRLEAAERIIRQYRGPGYDGAELRDALAAYDRVKESA